MLEQLREAADLIISIIHNVFSFSLRTQNSSSSTNQKAALIIDH